MMAPTVVMRNGRPELVLGSFYNIFSNVAFPMYSAARKAVAVDPDAKERNRKRLRRIARDIQSRTGSITAG